MNARRWLVLMLAILVVAGGVTLYLLPELVRRTAIARVEAMTDRPAAIDRVEVDLFTGRITVHGFRLSERDGQTPFADFERLELRVHLPPLLVGHLVLRELVLTDPTARVVRLPAGEFNFSDLIRRSGTTSRALDVTVERFRLTGGTVTLEDQALPERRTWTSEAITVDARNVSTRRDDGQATGRSVTGGAPVSVEVTNLRLHPVRLQATVTVEGLDLTPARVYLPPDAPVVLSGGRASMSVAVALDAREGLRGDATGRFEDITAVRRDGGEPLARVPGMTARVSGFALAEGALQVGELAVDGTLGVRDPLAQPGAPFRVSKVRAHVADFTWPATAPGRLHLQSSIPGGGSVTLTGSIEPPPAPSQLRLRVANADLAPWAQFLPVGARLTGVAEADLRMSEPLAAGIPARVHGAIAVNRLGVADARQQVLRARRIEARGLELQWPARVVVGRILVTEPRGTIERDHAGGFPVTDLLAGRADAAATAPREPAAVAGAPPLAVDIREIVVRNGALAWRDHTVSPPARLDVSNVEGAVTGAGWPLPEWARVHLAVRPPGGGRLQVAGRIGFHPLSAELRVRASSAELGPYQPYLPTTASVTGLADVDLTLAVPSIAEGRAAVRGNASLSRVDVRDREQTVLRVERAEAGGVDVDWPARVVVGRLALTRPWVVLERDDKGAVPLRALLVPSPSGSTADRVENGRDPLAVTVSQVSVDGGGMRIVDRAVSPAFAVDFQPVTLRMEDLSTASEKPARLELSGRLGPGAELALRGTVGAVGGPLRLAVAGELHQFAVARANPYVLQQAGWKTTEGRLTSTVQAQVEGDALSASAEIRLSRLQLVRAAPEDGAQARIGLPLNLLTALMKDRHGDITVSFPVGGRLGDPRFDFSEAIWSAVRTVAIRAVTLPVAWIGRVRFTPDSRIEGIDVDPVIFEPGSPELTEDGRTQASRLATFLEELPDVRLTLTPVVSSDDVTALERRAVEARLARVAREQRLSREAAATRLFEQAFPDRPAPDSLDSVLEALLSREAAPADEVSELGTKRLEALRDTITRAGIDRARLSTRGLVQRDPGNRIELDVLEPEMERPSRIRETLERLGVPRRGD